ncbi:hypothetical protein M3Y96_00518400 [Aphelenchoides besseyi]|nr:hypothetical protein M3Y96_00518400 [Aphelenchoides besseyi]
MFEPGALNSNCTIFDEKLGYHQQAGEMGNVESRCALLKLRKKNEHTDFHQQEGSRSRVRFFASLLADNPTLEEYSMKGKFEAVNWLINYFYWGPSETFNNDELADNFSKYFDDLYLLSVRYSIYQLHEPFIESNMSEVALKDVHERIELAAKNEDYLLLKLLSGYLNRNGEEKKRLEDKLAKLVSTVIQRSQWHKTTKKVRRIGREVV